MESRREVNPVAARSGRERTCACGPDLKPRVMWGEREWLLLRRDDRGKAVLVMFYNWESAMLEANEFAVAQYVQKYCCT